MSWASEGRQRDPRFGDAEQKGARGRPGRGKEAGRVTGLEKRPKIKLAASQEGNRHLISISPTAKETLGRTEGRAAVHSSGVRERRKPTPMPMEASLSWRCREKEKAGGNFFLKEKWGKEGDGERKIQFVRRNWFTSLQKGGGGGKRAMQVRT